MLCICTTLPASMNMHVCTKPFLLVTQLTLCLRRQGDVSLTLRRNLDQHAEWLDVHMNMFAEVGVWSIG